MALGKKKRAKTAKRATAKASAKKLDQPGGDQPGGEPPAGQQVGGEVKQSSGRGLSVFDDLDHLFEDFLKRRWPGAAGGPMGMWRSPRSGANERVPSVDVADRGDAIVVRAELPGVKQEDLAVSVVDRMLTIRAVRKEEHEVRDKDYYRQEIHTGEFSRSVLLPAEVDPDQAKASFKDGILEMTLPKTVQTRRRKIRFGS